MTADGIRPSILLFLIGIGLAVLLLIGVNVVVFVIDYRRGHIQAATSLSKWAWGVSAASLLFPYVAVVSASLVVIDLVRRRQPQAAASRRGRWMALVNSAVAVGMLILVLGVFVGRWLG